MQKNKLKAAILGVGAIANIHLPTIRETDGVEAVALVDSGSTNKRWRKSGAGPWPSCSAVVVITSDEERNRG